MLHIHDIIIGVQCMNRWTGLYTPYLISVFLHLKNIYTNEFYTFAIHRSSRSKTLFASSQTFQKEKVAEGSPWAVAHFTDSWAFAYCALLANVALERQNKDQPNHSKTVKNQLGRCYECINKTPKQSLHGKFCILTVNCSGINVWNIPLP